jgi:CRISPR-associated protein Cas1
LGTRATIGDDLAWAERCAYWRASPDGNVRPRRNRRQNHEPLVLAGHGLALRVDHRALLIRNGFTHYPRHVEEYRFFPRDRAMPSRIIVVDGSGALSFDALAWLSEQGVPLVQVNWRGEVTTAIGAGNAIDRDRVAAQLDASRSGKALPLQQHLSVKKFGTASIPS